MVNQSTQVKHVTVVVGQRQTTRTVAVILYTLTDRAKPETILVSMFKWVLKTLWAECAAFEFEFKPCKPCKMHATSMVFLAFLKLRICCTA
jgi:hypothetical protein